MSTLTNDFPPKLKKCTKCLLTISAISLLGALIFSVGHLCNCWDIFVTCLCCPYLSLLLILFFFILTLYLLHEHKVFEACLKEQSRVESTIAYAKGPLKLHLTENSTGDERPLGIETKRDEIKKEVQRLSDGGSNAWTENNVLLLEQYLIPFMSTDELIANAYSSLTDLEDFAADSRYSYDQSQYRSWKERIDQATNSIDEVQKNKELERYDSAESLRAELFHSFGVPCVLSIKLE